MKQQLYEEWRRNIKKSWQLLKSWEVYMTSYSAKLLLKKEKLDIHSYQLYYIDNAILATDHAYFKIEIVDCIIYSTIGFLSYISFLTIA